MQGLKTHSLVDSGWLTKPREIWKTFIQNLGPNSFSPTVLQVSFSQLWCRNEMRSSLLANVITLLESTFGTGKMCFRMLATLSPSLLEKLWKIRWGQASGMLGILSFTSCLSTTFSRPKQMVGPTGKWHRMSPSGTPRCSCSSIRSVRFLLRHRSTRSFITQEPRLILSALGRTIAISFRNCISRLEGSREVVMRICGSEYTMLAYSSSMWVLGIMVFMSSDCNSSWSFSFSRNSSVGSLLLFCCASNIFCFFSLFSFSSAYLSRVNRYSRRCRMFFLSMPLWIAIVVVINSISQL